jgi:hypothetical protein
MKIIYLIVKWRPSHNFSSGLNTNKETISHERSSMNVMFYLQAYMFLCMISIFKKSESIYVVLIKYFPFLLAPMQHQFQYIWAVMNMGEEHSALWYWICYKTTIKLDASAIYGKANLYELPPWLSYSYHVCFYLFHEPQLLLKYIYSTQKFMLAVWVAECNTLSPVI